MITLMHPRTMTRKTRITVSHQSGTRPSMGLLQQTLLHSHSNRRHLRPLVPQLHNATQRLDRMFRAGILPQLEKGTVQNPTQRVHMSLVNRLLVNNYLFNTINRHIPNHLVPVHGAQPTHPAHVVSPVHVPNPNHSSLFKSTLKSTLQNHSSDERSSSYKYNSSKISSWHKCHLARSNKI